jgi:drug/metabolite transporter (DMT)-like permease
MQRPLVAAVLALASVGCFAGGDALTQQLTNRFSVVTVLAFRTLTGTIILLSYIVLTRRRLEADSFRKLLFYAWALVFAATIAMYGFALSNKPLAEVYIITSLMPLIVIAIQLVFQLEKSPIRLAQSLPLLVMFVAVIGPNIYRAIHTPKSEFMWEPLVFASGAALCHAIWTVLAPMVAKDLPETSAEMRMLSMFAVATVALLIASNTDAAHVVELVTRRTAPEFRFVGFAERPDIIRLGVAGALNAVGVLLFVSALTVDSPTNVAPYDYTIPLWGIALGAAIPSHGPVAETELPLGVNLASALAIFLGAVWFYRARRT